MSDYLVTDTELTSVADAIRAKGGTSANLSFPTGFVSAIEAISSGGGLEYEEGTYIPSKDTMGSSIAINFSKAHSTRPFYMFFQDSTNTSQESSSILYWNYVDFTQLGGKVLINTSSSTPAYVYGQIRYFKRGSSGGMSGSDYSDTASSPPFQKVVYTNKFNLGISAYCRTGRTYKWIAIWK